MILCLDLCFQFSFDMNVIVVIRPVGQHCLHRRVIESGAFLMLKLLSSLLLEVLLDTFNRE